MVLVDFSVLFIKKDAVCHDVNEIEDLYLCSIEETTKIYVYLLHCI